MFKQKLNVLAGSALMALSMGVNADIIDLFSTYQGPYTDATVDATAVGGSVGGGADATILGGERDLWVSLDAGVGGDATVRVGNTQNVGGDNLFYDALVVSMDAGMVATAGVQWDGADNSIALNPAGLGSLDLTAGGTLTKFEVVTLSSDAGGIGFWTFDITAYSNGGADWTNISLVATVVPSGTGPVTSYIDFAGFSACGYADAVVTVTCSGVTGADLTDLSALEVLFNTSGSADVDLRVVSVETVPEPSMLALLGAGFLAGGFVTARSRKRKAA